MEQARVYLSKACRHFDWLLVGSALALLTAGLLTMNSFTEDSYHFDRQLMWIAISLVVFFIASRLDWHFLRRSGVLVTLYSAGIGLVLMLNWFGQSAKGAERWFSLGGIAFQPADFMKLILILILAKYLSRRHIEIANIRHILISGAYALVPFALILIQPAFGSAVIIFLIWLGMIIFSGISKKHLALVFGIAIVSFLIAWLFVFQPYQKARIITFVHPLSDIRGAGYNAFQSTIAIGSGQVLGKGVGLGTQSRLKFLPEYQTDFVFAAFAEEWGLVGATLLLALFGVVVWRIIHIAMMVETNFEALFGIGLAIFFMSHFIINVGMNLGLLPVTGLYLPLVSYGGSHLLAEFLGLGILTGMSRRSRGFHRDDIKNEFVGVG